MNLPLYAFFKPMRYFKNGNNHRLSVHSFISSAVVKLANDADIC